MTDILFKSILWFLLLSQLLMGMGAWGEESPSAPLSQPSTETAETHVFEALNALTWKGAPEGAKCLTLADVLNITDKQDLEAQISREKIIETEAKQEDVETKRVLFFFKYFDAAYLEGSAESDVMAAAAHAQAVTQSALLESVQKYYALMKAALAQYIAYQAIEQGKNQLALNQKQFLIGETTSFDLMQTKTQLVKRYQDYLQAEVGYQSASLALAEQLRLEGSTVVSPSDLTFQPPLFTVPVFQIFPETLQAEEAVTIAIEHRPDLKELKFKRISLENLIKTFTVRFAKVQSKILNSSLKQLSLRQEKSERGVAAMVRKAYEEYLFAHKKLGLAHQQLALAEKGLQQAQVSHQSGFSSNKDVLDAQVAYAQAQVNDANTLIEYNLSQVQLLYEMGLINVETLLAGKVEL